MKIKITKEDLKKKLTKAKDVVVAKAKWTWGFSKDVANVIRENKEVTAHVVIGLVTVGTAGYKVHAAGKSIEKEASEFDTRVDTNDGQHLHTKRAMTAAERKQLTRRQRAGEDTTQILEDMDLM